MHRHQGARNHHIAGSREAHSRPAAPIVDAARDHHARGGNLDDLASCSSVHAQPGISRQPALVTTVHELDHRGQRLQVLRGRPNRREHVLVAEGLDVLAHRIEDHPRGTLSAIGRKNGDLECADRVERTTDYAVMMRPANDAVPARRRQLHTMGQHSKRKRHRECPPDCCGKIG
jgi:hypothetical protein